MAVAGAAQKSTGPVLDTKLGLEVWKLHALEATLDKVAAAVKAVPTPSEVRASSQCMLAN